MSIMNASFSKRLMNFTPVVGTFSVGFVSLVLLILTPSPTLAQRVGVKGRPTPVSIIAVDMGPQGFLPSSLEITDRKVMLVVMNRDRSQPIDVSVQALDTNDRPIAHLRRWQAEASTKRWVTVVDLEPGKYRLVDGSGTRTLQLTVR